MNSAMPHLLGGKEEIKATFLAELFAILYASMPGKLKAIEVASFYA